MKIKYKNYEDIQDAHKIIRFIPVYCFQYFSMNIGLRALLAYYEVRLENYTGSICKWYIIHLHVYALYPLKVL